MLWYVRWTMLGVLLWMLLITLPWASRRANELTLESTPASELEASDQNRQFEDQLARLLFRDLAMRGMSIDGIHVRDRFRSDGQRVPRGRIHS